MFIESTGMVCSVGLTAESACAAMRAGIANFQELPYLDNQGEPIIGAMVPGLPPDIKRGERLNELLAMAIVDCLTDKIAESLEQIPLLIGLAEPDRPGGGAGLVSEMVARMDEKLGVRFHPQLSRAIATGHTSGFEGLRIARELFKKPEVSACLVCGVDSYINASSLLWLDQHQRLKTEENSDGVIPGEGAAAVLVIKRPSPNVSMAVNISGLGFAKEAATVFNEEPLLGFGLAEATKSALSEAGIQLHEADFRISDVTGESYGFREQALSLSRVMRSRKEEFPIWHSSDSIGDIGAASGMSQLVIYWHSACKDYLPGKQAVCYTSAVLGVRAVAITNALESR